MDVPREQLNQLSEIHFQRRLTEKDPVNLRQEPELFIRQIPWPRGLFCNRRVRSNHAIPPYHCSAADNAVVQFCSENRTSTRSMRHTRR